MYAFFTLFFLLISCTQEMIDQQTIDQQIIADNNDKDIQTRSQQVSGYQILQTNTPPSFKVKNGLLTFKNESDYVAMFYYLTGKGEKELFEWSKANGYTSLLNEYAIKDSIFMSTFIPTRDYEPGESPIDKSERITDPVFATLFNNNGIVLVGDTIYKLRGEYVYLISDKELAKLDEINKAKDKKSLNHIPSFQHTIKPGGGDKVSLRSGNYERSNVFYVNSTFRVFVNFYSDYKRISNNSALTHRSYMSGRKQTKVLVWLPDTSDPISSGRINSVAEGYNGISFTVAGVFNGWNIYNQVDIYGATFGPVNVGSYRFTETFIFIKHTSQGAEDTYTNQYFYTL